MLWRTIPLAVSLAVSWGDALENVLRIVTAQENVLRCDDARESVLSRGDMKEGAPLMRCTGEGRPLVSLLAVWGDGC